MSVGPTTQLLPGARWCATLLLVALLAVPSAQGQGDFEERFERVWSLVDERYWNLESRAVDWERVGDRYREEALGAKDEREFHEVLVRMYEELGDDHSVYVPPERVSEIREAYGDLPCLALLGQGSVSGGEENEIGRIGYRSLEGIGYLRIPDLASPGIAGDARAAVRALEERGATALVVDLRGNPGGRLVEMMQVAGIFTRGFLWRVLTRWSLPMPYPALGAVETELPLAVLVDGSVNSAAEGLAGALQRQGRAVIVGEATAGNVEAVLPFCLRDGSQAWIATGVLAPIGAPSWEGQGVVPDVASDPEEALEAALRYLRER